MGLQGKSGCRDELVEHSKQIQADMKPKEHTLTPEEELRLQTAMGLFLFCGQAVDTTMPHALTSKRLVRARVLWLE